ncbi:MAG TPA: hypothetical protein VM733_21220 [Thermoanaerobaculia bacterium]|nr:hypothetical protein [Thermoanaerobaculia bacterium]
MTLLNWTSALLLAGPIALLVFAFRRRDARTSATFASLLTIYILGAAAPLVFALLWRFDATRAAIELHGIAFRTNGAELRKEVRERRPNSGRIVIGDRLSRRARAAQRLFGTLVFAPAATNGKGTLRIELPTRAQRAGLISTDAQGILGAEMLQDGDQLCIGGACWTYDDREFTLGKTVVEIPARKAELPGVGISFPLPFAQPITAGLRTWSVDFLAHQNGGIAAERRLRSFLCHSSPGPRLRLVNLDDDVMLMRNGARVSTPSKFDVADNARMAFYSLPGESAEFAAPGVTERRSVVYRAGSRSFVLDLDTPEIHTLTMSELKALQLAQEKGATKKKVALAMGDAELVDRSLYFAGLSESVAIEANALLELSRFFPRDFASSFRILSPRGPIDAQLGGVQWIGSSDLAAVRLDVLRPPLLLLLLGIVLLVFKAGAAANARFTTSQALMAGAIELLCGVRLLMGYRVWSMPPHKAEAAELATVAWMALPWIFIAACVPIRALREWRDARAGAAPAFAGLLFSAVFCARAVEGPTKWIWVLCHLLAIVAVLVRSEEMRARFTRLAEKTRERTSRIQRFDPELTPVVLCALVFTIVRVALLAFGWKESASLGVRVSLSVVHIPAAAILQGFYLWRTWQRVQKNGRLLRNDLLAALAILLFVWVIPAAVTSDVGLALLNVPLFVLILLAISRHADERAGRWIPRVLVAVIVLLLAGAPLLRLFVPLVASEERLLSFASDSNFARVLHFAAPERLQEMATKRGESLAITSAILQSYISSGFFGRGYGHSEVSVHLGDTALRDFAPAVFIAAEWGLAGTVAMLLIYLLFAIIASDWLPWSGFDGHPGPAIAFVAAATIAVSSIYMILANHELLLLTGKNMYLFGLDSAGDVIEVIVLVLLIAYGSSIPREDERAMTYEGTYGGYA